MPSLHLPATDKTPEILFDRDAGMLEMRGCSIHENAEGFFRPLLEMAEDYARRPAPLTTVKLAMTYFNSSSSKYLLDLLKALDEIHITGAGNVVMEWHYDQEDLDMEEAGRDYKDLLEMPVTLVRSITG